MVETVTLSSERTPLLALSSASASRQRFHTAFVRSVGLWSTEINVRDFVSHNITPYYGDASFLEGPTERTKAVWNRCLEDVYKRQEQFYLYETTLLFQTKNYICKKPTNNSDTYENFIYP